MNRENLKTLATYLLSGKLMAQFNMHYFADSIPGTKDSGTCGTVGCAVGHGPYALPHLPKLCRETWPDYCERVFGVMLGNQEGVWCFDSAWAGLDNTAEGAAKRILYLLDHDVDTHYKFYNEFYKDAHAYPRLFKSDMYISTYEDYYENNLKQMQ